MTVRDIRTKNIIITKQPIVYYWWFKVDCFQNLLSRLNSEIDLKKLVIKKYDNQDYGLLYIGKGINGHDRLIKYHMHDSQNFHSTGVQNGRLSSLRQTLCGLLQLPMSTSKEMINNFMDENCAIEFEVCDANELDRCEYEKISKNYLPLNYQNTKGVLTKRHRQILTECKKRVRK